jgi:hypothetical protein
MMLVVLVAANDRACRSPELNFRNVPPEIGELPFLDNLRRHQHKSKPVMCQESGFWQA